MTGKQIESNALLTRDDLRMLAAMRHGLQASVAAELSSELARTICGFSIEYLDKLIIRHTEWPALLRRQIERQAQVTRQVAEMLYEMGIIETELHAAAYDIAHQGLSYPGDSLPELERTQHNLDAMQERLVPLLAGDKRLRQGNRPELVSALLREHIASVHDSERDFNAAIKARVERHAALVESHVAVTQEKLQDYFRARFPERRDIEIVSFQELPGGSSKSTILIDVRGFENDGVTPLVVRLDREAGSTDTRVIDEVPTLRTMFTQGLPVPEVILVEPDATKIGLAFIVVRKIDARLGGNMWQVDPQLCNVETARDLARILARLHTLDAVKLGLRGALNSDPDLHPMKGLIDNIRELWATRKIRPDATLEACLCWLEQHMPPVPAKPSLVHADVSFHNILVKDKMVAGLLDWELSHLGDPNEDLSYARPCIEQMIPWEEFLAEYRKHGGGEYSEEIGHYYGVWRGVRNAVYTLVCHHSFHTGANPDLRWGFFAANYRLVLLEAADKVAQAGVQPI